MQKEYKGPFSSFSFKENFSSGPSFIKICDQFDLSIKICNIWNHRVTTIVIINQQKVTLVT